MEARLTALQTRNLKRGLSYKYFYYTGFDEFIIWFSFTVLIISWAHFANVMNIVFTNNTVSTTDVPCYTDDLYLGLGTYWYDQYLFEWWLLLAYWVSIIYPLYEIYVWSGAVTQGYKTRIENMFISAVVFIVFAINFGVLAYQSFFCADFNFCRSCDCEQKFDCFPNSSWWFRLMFTLFFLIVTLIYGTLALLGEFEYEAKERVKRWSVRAKAIMYLRKQGYDVY